FYKVKYILLIKIQLRSWMRKTHKRTHLTTVLSQQVLLLLKYLDLRFQTGFSTHPDRKSTRLNSSHVSISYAVFCLKKKMTQHAPGGLDTEYVPAEQSNLER